MTLHQLRIATAVAKHLSITKVSQELHISQPAVSLQVRLLEEEYGIRLYEKNGRGIQLTQEGKKFIDSVEQILLRVDNLENEYKGILTAPNHDSLTIGGCYFASENILPVVLKAFKKTHLDAQLFIETKSPALIEDLVLKSKVDIALIVNPSFFPSIAYESYREEKLVAVISTHHPLARRKKLSITELCEVPLVIKHPRRGPGIAGPLFKALERQGIATTIELQCETAMATKAAIKAGLGLGILLGKHVEPDIQRGELKVVKIPQLNRTIMTYIIYYKERTLAPAAKDFLALLIPRPQKTNGSAPTRRAPQDMHRFVG